jgi:hypothetical protein
MAVGRMAPDQFLVRLLSEVFTWWRRLPSWSDEVDGLASPLHRHMTLNHLPTG